MKICEKHSREKIQITYTTGGKTRTQFICEDCRREYKENWYNSNRDKILKQKSIYYKDNQEVLDQKNSEYYKNNKEDITKYKADWFQDNKEEIYQTRRERYASDVSFRLRDIFSKTIRQKLKIAGSSKDDSCIEFVNYSMQELKVHLEQQFESWMTWDNHGKYDAKIWDDNNSTTWTWQIDHIIPQSDLPYTSMDDDNFKKCWALSNLRPLSAKNNLLDGLTRIRHK